MPQLDKLSYMTQLIWVIAIIVVLYVLSYSYILPILATTLKYRIKKNANIELEQNWYSLLLNNSVIIYVVYLCIIIENYIYIYNFYKLVYVVYVNNIINKKVNEVVVN